MKVSDVHFSSDTSGMRIYFRKNGQLSQVDHLDSQDTKTVSALIKLHAQMDISLSRLPQDGRIQLALDDTIKDIRVSSLPTFNGEDFVCRLFESKRVSPDFEALGFTPQFINLFTPLLDLKSGLILVTGATGSGKTTTLYTCLSYILSKGFKNIITLEDPIEMEIPGTRQSQINPGIGYGFVNGLKACLRQDPDVIMVGEIRDEATAKTALEAAYTGHLVLSTLHTQDCKSSLLRLKSFGLDPFWIHYALKGVVSQTLIPQQESRIPLTELLIPNTNIDESQKVLDYENALHYYSWEEDIRLKKAINILEDTYEYSY